MVVVVGDGRGLAGVWRRGFDGVSCGGPTPLLLLLCPLYLLVQGVEAPGRGGAVEGAAADRGAIIRWPWGGGGGDAVPSRRAAEGGVGGGQLRRTGEVSSERRQPPTAWHPGCGERGRLTRHQRRANFVALIMCSSEGHKYFAMIQSPKNR